MKLQFLLIWLILARTLMGASCSPPADAVLAEHACCHPACQDMPCCIELSAETLACHVCCACKGAVTPLPTADHTPHSSIQLASLFPADPGCLPPFAPDSEWRKPIHDFQMLHGVPWIERLRPIVCIWTI